ncbi:hypothetical protein LJC16_01570 [Bacteroidales bacterium OttesenSCG-928-C19]|nr:hypothetical protein [Bacteroidales bacterium OttesenSCG-928-C19]
MGGVIIVLLIVGAIAYFWLAKDSANVRKLYKDRTPEQKDAIRYFLSDGCLSKTMSDSQYDEMVRRKVDSLNLRKKAIDKIGLDEDEIKEIEPVNLEGYRYEKAYQKYGKDKQWRSSKYEVTWIFASDKQLYVYSYMFNTDEDGKRERTEEYFWKDITNFSTITETKEVGVEWDKKKGEYKSRKNIDEQDFGITVPGEKYICAAEVSESVERAIQAMKAKLREKKNVQ